MRLVPASVALLLLVPAPAEATTVLVYIRSDGSELVIASDSRRTQSRADGTVRGTNDACKVRVYGRVVLAFTGRVVDEAFSILRIADTALGAGGVSLKTRLDNFLEELVRASLEHYPPENLRNRRRLGTFVVGGLDERSPVVAAVPFPLYSKDTLVARLNPGRLFAYGTTNLIADATIDEDISVYAQLISLIRDQEDGTPNVVGGPVDVVTLTSEGINRQGMKADCQPDTE